MDNDVQMPASQGPEAGHISRRDVIRRGAVVGGALMWAAPAMQRMAAGPAFAVGTAPPTSPPTPTLTGVAYVGLVFTCDGTTYRAKWQAEGGWVNIADPALPDCTIPAGWDDATVYPNPAAIGISTVFIGGQLYQVTFTLPATCSAGSGSGAAGAADGSYCVAGVVGADPRIITFTAVVQ